MKHMIIQHMDGLLRLAITFSKKSRVAETFDMQEAIRRAVRNGAVIQYDTVSQSPFYRYQDNQGRTHEVWFENARSAQAKFDTVKQSSPA